MEHMSTASEPDLEPVVPKATRQVRFLGVHEVERIEATDALEGFPGQDHGGTQQAVRGDKAPVYKFCRFEISPVEPLPEVLIEPIRTVSIILDAGYPAPPLVCPQDPHQFRQSFRTDANIGIDDEDISRPGSRTSPQPFDPRIVAHTISAIVGKTQDPGIYELPLERSSRSVRRSVVDDENPIHGKTGFHEGFHAPGGFPRLAIVEHDGVKPRIAHPMPGPGAGRSSVEMRREPMVRFAESAGCGSIMRSARANISLHTVEAFSPADPDEMGFSVVYQDGRRNYHEHRLHQESTPESGSGRPIDPSVAGGSRCSADPQEGLESMNGHVCVAYRRLFGTAAAR